MRTADSSRPFVLFVQPICDHRLDGYVRAAKRLGFTPVQIANPRAALVVAPKAAVVVTETLLPGGIDGMEFIRRLRSRRTPPVPIIVLTSCAWLSEREKAEAAGCQAFLANTCDAEEFVSVMRGLLPPFGRPGCPARARLPGGRAA